MTQAQLDALAHRLAYDHALGIVETTCLAVNPTAGGRLFYDTRSDGYMYEYERPELRRALKYLRARGLIEDGVQPHSVRVKAVR